VSHPEPRAYVYAGEPATVRPPGVTLSPVEGRAVSLRGAVILAAIVAFGAVAIGFVQALGPPRFAAAGASDVLLGPAPSPAQLRAEAARVPAHVQTWYYYGLVGVNEHVPPEIMARYADFVEVDDYGEFAVRFKAAGGRYAAAYTDPAYVPYCDPPFRPPVGRCKSEYSRLVADESGWFHGPDGTRIRHYVPGDRAYQEALNPASPAAHRAWREFTALVKRRAPAIDFLFSDDSGGPLHAGNMSPTSAHFYDFNAAGVEIRSDEAFRDAWISYLGESALPLILNGSDPVTEQVPYGGAFLRPPFVRGNVHEGCLRADSGLKTLKDEGGWSGQQDALLENARMKRWGICFMTGTPTAENRLYALASWWLTYDPQWSVAAPTDAIPSQTSLMPEYSLVPRFPTRTAVSHVTALQTETGAFAREFAGCYQNRALIGECAAIVNPRLNVVAMPQLAQRYHRSLVLTGGDVISGGALTWSPGIPAVLAPASAALLVR